MIYQIFRPRNAFTLRSRNADKRKTDFALIEKRLSSVAVHRLIAFDLDCYTVRRKSHLIQNFDDKSRRTRKWRVGSKNTGRLTWSKQWETQPVMYYLQTLSMTKCDIRLGG